MASVPKLLLLSLLFFLSCYRSHIAHAGDDGSYKVLSIGSQSLRTNKSVCSESKGAVLSVHAPAVSFPWTRLIVLCTVLLIYMTYNRFPCFDGCSQQRFGRRPVPPRCRCITVTAHARRCRPRRCQLWRRGSTAISSELPTSSGSSPAASRAAAAALVTSSNRTPPCRRPWAPP